jgi:hypothetical protein
MFSLVPGIMQHKNPQPRIILVGDLLLFFFFFFLEMHLVNRTPATSAPSDGGLSGGATAGIVAAVVTFVVAINIGLSVYWKRRANRKNKAFPYTANQLGDSFHRRFRVSDYKDQVAHRYPEVPGECLRNPNLERIDIQYSQMRENARAWQDSEYAVSIASWSLPRIRIVEEDEVPAIRTTIDPWELEYRPNPVIFAHLADCVGSPHNDETQPEILHQVNTSLGEEVTAEPYVSQNHKRRLSDSSDLLETERGLDSREVPTTTSVPNKRRMPRRYLAQEPSLSIPKHLTLALVVTVWTFLVLYTYTDGISPKNRAF